MTRGLTFDELAERVPIAPPQSYGIDRLVATVLRSELDRGRLIQANGRYVLVRQAFPADQLDALERLGQTD